MITLHINTINEMIIRSFHALNKLNINTSSYTLLINRINALNVALDLLKTSNDPSLKLIYTIDELKESLLPLKSIVSKSEKAILKLRINGWQYKMLKKNIDAVNMSISLLINKTKEI